MSVYIACDKCDKRLKIPESVVGHAIKCPVCGSVFKSTPEKVVPDKAGAVPPARSGPRRGGRGHRPRPQKVGGAAGR